MPDLATTSDTLTQAPKFSLTEHAIAELSHEYMPLEVDGLDDKIGYANVHSARMVVRSHRCEIEKKRKEFKADALAYGRTVDGEAKRLTALLAPVESHLIAEEKKVDDAKEAIREEKRLAAEAAAQAVKDAEAAEAKRIADEEAAFVKAEQDAENERLRVEREKLEAEREVLRAAEEAQEKKRLADEQAANVARMHEEKKQRQAQEKIDAERLAHDQKMKAERKAIEDETNRLAGIEDARVRVKELEKAKAEAAERAEKETVARIAREKEEALAKAEAEKAATLRAESLRPDKEKLLSVADAIKAIPLPTVSADARTAREEVQNALLDTVHAIYNIAEELS